MSRETPGVQWVDEGALRVKERDRRASIGLGKVCFGVLPAGLLLQAGAHAVLVVPVALLGTVYALVWVVRTIRMEFVAGPPGITIRDSKVTRSFAWSEVAAFVDAFMPATAGHVQWVLGVKTLDGSVVLAQMTACGKPQGRASTVQALRTVALRYGVAAPLTGDPASEGAPVKPGWYPDPGGEEGERFWNGATWGPVRRHPSALGPGTFESWEPRGDSTTALELYKTEARLQRRKRNAWSAITATVTIFACVLWGEENHKGGSFTFAALAFFAAAICALQAWTGWQVTRRLERTLAVAASPVPLAVGTYVAPASGAAPSAPPVLSLKRDRMAVWSLVCSLAGGMTIVTAPIGIILGFKARRRLRRDGGARRDVHLATAGIAIGSLVALLLIIGVVVEALVPSAPTERPDVAMANRALLRASDYGKGWQDQGSGSGTFEASFFNSLSHKEVAQMYACLGLRPTSVDTRPTEVVGHQFAAHSGMLWATDTIDIFPTADGAADDDRAAASADAAACVERLGSEDKGPFQADAYLMAMTPSDAFTVVRRQGLRTLGAGDADLEVSFPDKLLHGTGVLYIDMIFLRHRRMESNLWVVHQGGQPPLGVVDPLVAAAKLRLTAG